MLHDQLQENAFIQLLDYTLNFNDWCVKYVKQLVIGVANRPCFLLVVLGTENSSYLQLNRLLARVVYQLKDQLGGLALIQ
jgi:hypothetical protein